MVAPRKLGAVSSWWYRWNHKTMTRRDKVQGSIARPHAWIMRLDVEAVGVPAILCGLPASGPKGHPRSGSGLEHLMSDDYRAELEQAVRDHISEHRLSIDPADLERYSDLELNNMLKLYPAGPNMLLHSDDWLDIAEAPSAILLGQGDADEATDLAMLPVEELETDV